MHVLFSMCSKRYISNSNGRDSYDSIKSDKHVYATVNYQ